MANDGRHNESLVTYPALADTPLRRSRPAAFCRGAALALSDCRWDREDERPASHRRADHWSCRRRRLFCLSPRSRALRSGPASTPHRGRAGPWSHPRPCRSLSHCLPQGTPALSGNWFTRGDDTSIRYFWTYFILFPWGTMIWAVGRGGQPLLRCRRAAAWCAGAVVWQAAPALMPILPLSVPPLWVAPPSAIGRCAVGPDRHSTPSPALPAPA